MKRIVSLLLAVVMIMGLGVTVLAAGSPTAGETSGTTTAAQPRSPMANGMKLYNADGEKIATVPANAVRKTSVGNANKLNDDDREAFLAAYEEAKKIDDKVVKYFFWLDIPEKYKTDDLAYFSYIFTCTGKNVEVQVNGKDMEVKKIGRYTYEAKLTEFGAVAILCD